MDRRRMMMAAAKELVTVVECLKTVGSGTWVAPDETDSIDYCVIAGGGNSVEPYLSGSYHSTSGAGGSGGQVINVLSFSTTSIKNMSYTVGNINQDSSFYNTTSVANYKAGASAVGSTTNYNTTVTNGNNGSNGGYLFSNDYNTGYFGVSGGSGGFIRCDNFGEYNAYGGYPNGGNAYILDMDTSTIIVQSGGSGSNYGNGGGGTAILFNGSLDYYYRSNANGKQGAIFIRYSRYKKSSDVISTVNGHKIVKINW